MKKILLPTLILGCFTLSFALEYQNDTTTYSNNNLKESKRKIIESIDETMSALRQSKRCVKRARNSQELYECKPENSDTLVYTNR